MTVFFANKKISLVENDWYYISPFSRTIGSEETETTLSKVHFYSIGDRWTLEGNLQLTGDTVDGPIYSLSNTTGYRGTGTINYSFSDPDINFLEFISYRNAHNSVGTASRIFRSNDTISGSTDADTLLGFDGNDILRGSNEASADNDLGDIMLGNAGNDILYGYAGNDSMVGGSDLLDANAGNDILYGGDGDDHIYGSGGNDAIYGDNGNDLLVGAQDNDILTGGEGNDIFVNIWGSGHDTITDFSNGDIITIQRTNLISDYADVIQNATQSTTGTTINLAEGSSVTLSGVDLSNLTSGDFFFY